MTTEPTAVPALCPAAFAKFLVSLPAETRGDYVAVENGVPWARVSVGPYGSMHLAIFPVGVQSGERGDTGRRAQAGVVLTVVGDRSERVRVAELVTDRARRMCRS